MKMRWEYMKRWGSPWLTIETLNNLGAEGWELVGIMHTGAAFGESGWLFFKRQVQS